MEFDIDFSGGKANQHGRAHPLACHLLDVAAVAEARIVLAPEQFVRHADELAADPAALRRLVLWLVAMHDIGKASAAFQWKSEAHWPAELLGPYPRFPGSVPHGAISLWYLMPGRGPLGEMLTGCGAAIKMRASRQSG